MSYIFILQAAAAANPQHSTFPEKQPALLTLVYVGGMALMALLLLVALWRYRARRSALSAIAPEDLPEEVRQRLGTTSTNRGLKALRWLYVLLALSVFGFHVYWAKYAEANNERFQEVSYKDLRNRRLSESSLRGWILDRNGDLNRALALYRQEGNEIVREYPLDKEMAQIFGSDRGDPGLERALFGIQSGALPESWQIVMGENLQQRANVDVRLTIDRDLQQAAAEQLKGKHGAVVILNPQTGEILAMYSEPSYSLKEVQDEMTWIRLEANQRDRPLVSRATSAYYIPGSTFKTVVMTAAFLAGEQDSIFSGSGGGYQAENGAKPIFDDNGSCEICGPMRIEQAFEISSNQYFAQMAVKLGPARLQKAAQLLGIGTYDSPEDLVRGRKKPEIINASTDAIKRAMAPREATILTNPKMRRYDLALEGFGQGYAGQMTPLQMALNVSAIGNLQGRLMKPMIEFGRTPEVFNQVMPPQIAQREREIMGLVTGGSSGTARGVFGPVHAQGIITGGKTGTAQKVMPVYDSRTGEPVKRKKQERDSKGNIIREYEEIVLDEDHPRIDGWFLCIAPLNNPQIAMAVIIEGGGYGSRSAAPVAAALVLKARDLGLLGNVPQKQNQNQQNKGKQQQKVASPTPNKREKNSNQ
ncbi:MAG: penicillin-binding transpeptidase domain-containing protein [Pyrinomonadaceae bacterium]